MITNYTYQVVMKIIFMEYYIVKVLDTYILNTHGEPQRTQNFEAVKEITCTLYSLIDRLIFVFGWRSL